MLNKKLAMYEFDLVLNMYKYQEDLPKVFERIELKHFQPDNKIVAELFRSIAVLWRDQKQINEVTLEFKMAQFDKIIEVLESNLHEEESIEDILTSQPIIEFKDHTMKRLFHGILRENINV